MNRTTTFRRKIIYIVVLLTMLLPLYQLGQPSTDGANGGGQLTALRHKYNIAESDLGEISPASETMKLATLGLRGVAATLLWNQAHEFKKLHEWDRLKATLNNIALLQPHFEKVWEHQAHNLAYNVSTEFDDYRQRYEMVREGTEFLTRGVRQNREAPRLIWYTGWFYGSKLGLSDEKKQFRRLFADDKILHDSLIAENIPVDSQEALGPQQKPDNWLVGRLWLRFGYDLVESGVAINRQTPINFYETGPKWRFKHAEAIEAEGFLDDDAEDAWRLASEDWDDFGDRSLETTSSFTIKLGRLADLIDVQDTALDRFRELTGDTYDVAMKEKVAGYPEETMKALLKKRKLRTKREATLIQGIRRPQAPDFAAIAKRSEPANRLKAVQLADEMTVREAKIRKTIGYRTQINYPFWEAVAEAEQEERTVRARRLVFQAEQANEEARIDDAIELFEEAFGIWEEVYDDYPILTVGVTAEDLFDSIRRYMIAIDSERIPDDFPLKEFVSLMNNPSGIVLHQDYVEARERAKKEEAMDSGAKAADAEAEAPASDSADAAPDEDKSGDEAAGDDEEKEMSEKPTETSASTEASESAEGDGAEGAEEESTPDEASSESDSESATTDESVKEEPAAADGSATTSESDSAEETPSSDR